MTDARRHKLPYLRQGRRGHSDEPPERTLLEWKTPSVVAPTFYHSIGSLSSPQSVFFGVLCSRPFGGARPRPSKKLPPQINRGHLYGRLQNLTFCPILGFAVSLAPVGLRVGALLRRSPPLAKLVKTRILYNLGKWSSHSPAPILQKKYPFVKAAAQIRQISQGRLGASARARAVPCVGVARGVHHRRAACMAFFGLHLAALLWQAFFLKGAPPERFNHHLHNQLNVSPC